MAILWIFDTASKPSIQPAIRSQVSSISHTTLHLRNPWVSDSVFMAKLYTAFILGLAAVCYLNLFLSDILEPHSFNAELAITIISIPPFFSLFLLYRIYLIKNLSDFYLNRQTKKIYFKRRKSLISFDWSSTTGGILRRTEFSGVSFTTSYALAFAPRREDGSLHQKDCLWIDSNEPTESDLLYVSEVWEYLRHFMDHGPDMLPSPGQPDWWHYPLHAICLTPAQAWRHYVPWRTGEPGEMQGKKNWQLPFWAVLFPYNFTLALCWYVVCRLFNIKAAPPPPEAFEEAPAKPSKRKRK